MCQATITMNVKRSVHRDHTPVGFHLGPSTECKKEVSAIPAAEPRLVSLRAHIALDATAAWVTSSPH